LLHQIGEISPAEEETEQSDDAAADEDTKD
jgi:hypothetical protein